MLMSSIASQFQRFILLDEHARVERCLQDSGKARVPTFTNVDGAGQTRVLKQH